MLVVTRGHNDHAGHPRQDHTQVAEKASKEGHHLAAGQVEGPGDGRAVGAGRFPRQEGGAQSVHDGEVFVRQRQPEGLQFFRSAEHQVYSGED